MDRPELAWIPLDSIEEDPENPNVEDLATFNDLVDTFRQHGYAAVEPITVVPLSEEKYRLVAGEHRKKAVRLSGIGDSIPAMIVPRNVWDEDQRQVAMVRSNVMKGRLDPTKFTALWNRLQATYGRDALQKMMGFGPKEAELRRLVKDIASTLPARMAADLAARADRIRSVEDLAAVVQSLFTKHGSTLPEHFVVFAFGGRTHLMVRCTPETFAPIRALAERCDADGRRMDEALAGALAPSKAMVQEGVS